MSLARGFKDFLMVLTGTATILGFLYLALLLLLGQPWIDANALYLFIHGLYLFLMPPLIWAFRGANKGPQFISPKVRSVLEDGILLVDPSEWIGHQTILAIYKCENDVERLVASGVVINIQTNKLVQIKPSSLTGDPIDIGKLKDIKNVLLIKPGVVQ